MPKQIPVVLLDHYQQDATTYCLLTRIRTKTGELFGFTDLDVDLVYDAAPGVDRPGDDFGEMVHKAENGGFNASRLESAADLSVDNAELSLVPDDTAITVKKMLAGLFDSAEVFIYRVNYLDLSMGHEMVAAGRLDAARVSQNIVYNGFRSLTDLLKEPSLDLWTKTCPHVFGGPKCPKEYEWVECEVTALDPDEPLRIFQTDESAPDDTYRFGIVEWLTGDNAGRDMETDGNDGGELTLALEMPFPIQIGDTLRRRRDCSKVYSDETHGCEFHWGVADRNLYFGGCPHIPTADNGTSQIPGAEVYAAD